MKTFLLNKRKCNRGLVLVAVLWMIVVMTIITSVVAQSSRLDTRISLGTAERIRCKWACRAGVEKAIAVLNDDLEDSDSLYDLWSDNPEDFNSVPLDMCSYTVNITDEASKLNINIATKEQLLYLPNMTEEIADSILDWRDDNSEITGGGAESGYYVELPYGYRARDGNFKTVRELLLVKGVREQLLYGGATEDYFVPYDEKWISFLTCYSYEMNKDSEGNNRVNINRGSERRLSRQLDIPRSYARWIVDNRPNDGYKSITDLITDNSPDEPAEGAGNSDEALPIDKQTFGDIVDMITVVDLEIIPGRVNVNTAGHWVLVALFEGDAELAEDIISYRRSLVDGMISLGELLDVKSMTIKKAQKFFPLLTVRSSVYTIHSVGRGDTTGAVSRLEVVAARDKTPTQILYWYTGAKY